MADRSGSSVLDDGYSPPKTVEATRRLVEDENVLMMYGSVGTPTNAAVQKYLNLKKVPQLFITTGASRFRDPKVYPWTMAFMPGYAAERDEFACRWMVDRDRKITCR